MGRPMGRPNPDARRQELLGHATIEMTMRYAHLVPDMPRQTVKLLDGLGTAPEPATKNPGNPRNEG